MNCPYCQTPVINGDRFCPKCGREQPARGPSRCGRCAQPLTPGESFCGSCGARVGSTPIPSQQRPSGKPPRPPQPPRRSRKGLKIALGILGVIVLLFIGLMLLPHSDKNTGDNSGSVAINLGKGEIKATERPSLVKTADWGEVPANQVIVVLKTGSGRTEADQVATSLGGKVVGYFEYLNLYQIETSGKTENDLKQAVDKASQDSRVELAMANQQVFMDSRIIGVRCDSLDSPIYNEDNRGKGFEAIGVQRAWDLIRTSGFKTNDVHVGIVDDGLYKGKNEFSGKISFDFPDPNADLQSPIKRADGTVHQAGSHGTGVAAVMAADPDNGGLTGVASILGKNLKVSMVNNFAPPYGNFATQTTPDPKDPTKVVCTDGNTYALGDLMALKKQIDSGATIINCSWGNSNANPAWAAVYKKFFEKMADEHKDVLFVCSAGNDGKALDGSRRFPSGLALPNMITVGNVMNDGTKCTSSNMSSANFEVTLAAPGEQVVRGIADDGTIFNEYGGTSNATPQVAAAAAMLRSLNPKLTAGDIKKILAESAAPGVSNENYSTPAPKELGKGILAVDKAVLKVINDLRQQKGQPPLTMDAALALGKIDLVADGGPKEYKITAAVPGVGPGGTDVTIELQGPGSIGGLSKQHLSADGTLTWNIILSGDSGTVHVKRLDNGSCWNTKLPPDMTGTWVGSFKIESFTASPGVQQGFKETKLTVVFDERKDSNQPFTGNARLEASYGVKITGTLNGSRISFRILGDPAQVFFSGEIIGGAISGTWNGHEEHDNQYLRANGSWSLQRQ